MARSSAGSSWNQKLWFHIRVGSVCRPIRYSIRILDRSADRSRGIQYVTVCYLIGRPIDPAPNREFGTKSAVTDRSTDRSVSSWIGRQTDPEANRNIRSALIGLPTDQGASGSVGRPIQMRTERSRSTEAHWSVSRPIQRVHPCQYQLERSVNRSEGSIDLRIGWNVWLQLAGHPRGIDCLS